MVCSRQAVLVATPVEEYQIPTQYKQILITKTFYLKLRMLNYWVLISIKQMT